MFGYAMRDQGYKGAVTHLLSLNPHIKDPNRIITGNILRLGVIPPTKPIIAAAPPTKPAQKPIAPAIAVKPPITSVVAPHDADNFWALSWLEENSNFLTIPSGVALGTVGNVMSNGNKALLAQVGDIYAEYKAGVITKGQYDYRRSLRAYTNSYVFKGYWIPK